MIKENKKAPHFNIGKNDINVAVVFSAPGRLEEEKKMPLSGKTGENFKEVIAKLRSIKLFENVDCIYDLRITNAASSIYFKKKNNKTEAPISDIKKAKNIERLVKEIEGKDFIIAFGKRAEVAVNILKNKLPHKKYIITRHLSPLSINKIKGAKNQEERIEYIVNCIKKQL